MRILQDSIDEALRGLPEQVLSALITHKLAAQGVKLSTRDRKRLTREILREGKDKFLLKGWKWWDHRKVSVDITPQDIEQIERKFTDFLEHRLPELIETATGDLSRKVLADLKRKWRAESRLQRRDLAGFRKRLYDRWKLPLEGLRMLLTISRELGSSINREIRQSTDASTSKHLIDVLVRSHARACQITEEILCLLEGGFADGALARWRTLHEVAVVASFVAAHGEEVAERYVLHQAVESKRAAADYEKCQQRLGYEPLKESEVKAAQNSYDAVIAKFGPDFGKGSYGWAAHHLKIAGPTFVDISAPRGSTISARTTEWRATMCMPTQRASFSSWDSWTSRKCFSRARAMPALQTPVTPLRFRWRRFQRRSARYSRLWTTTRPFRSSPSS